MQHTIKFVSNAQRGHGMRSLVHDAAKTAENASAALMWGSRLSALRSKSGSATVSHNRCKWCL